MHKHAFYVEIFSVSLAAILLEIAYTRIFSFKVYYLFTYLIIGMGLSGLGAGGVMVAIWKRLRDADPARLVPTVSFLGGATAAAGYVFIARTQLNFLLLTSHPIEMVKLTAVCLILALPFLAAGILIATILGWRSDIAGRLYGADLMGAALGCALAVPLLAALTPPTTVILASLVFAFAGIRMALRFKPLLVVGSALCGALLLLALNTRWLPEPSVDQAKMFDEYRMAGAVRFSKWNPVFRVDVTEHPGRKERGSIYLLFHDGQTGSAIRRYNGNPESLEYMHRDARSLPFSVVKDNPRVLIIGSAGGAEILVSLSFNAGHITAVELNPVTYSLLTKTYADYTGRLAENPKVKLINGEGRWFLRQAKETYDLIWFVATDSYAAMNASSSGSFVLTESYLYTVETLKDSLDHLAKGGVICAQFGEIDFTNRPNRTTRYLATARQAFREKSITPFNQHVLYATTPGFPPFTESIVLLGKSAFDGAHVRRYSEALQRIAGSTPRYLPSAASDSTPYGKAIMLPDRQFDEWMSRYPYQVDAVHDNSPFFWHFTGFMRAIFSPATQNGPIVDFENGVGERAAVALFALVTVIAAVLLLSPFIAIRKTWVEIPYKFRTALYFASLGLGFMFIEVVLIQMFTLFLGYPTYSLSVTLFGMLVSSGIGSLLSERYSANRGRSLVALLGILVALVLFYQLALPLIIERFIGGPLALRIGLVALLIAPMGVCLGSFMPLGLKRIADFTPHRGQLIAWAWAVNGFFSVIASVFSTIAAMVVGFKIVLGLAVLIYAVGVLALISITNLKPSSRG
jgi:spermidine synthase